MVNHMLPCSQKNNSIDRIKIPAGVDNNNDVVGPTNTDQLPRTDTTSSSFSLQNIDSESKEFPTTQNLTIAAVAHSNGTSKRTMRSNTNTTSHETSRVTTKRDRTSLDDEDEDEDDDDDDDDDVDDIASITTTYQNGTNIDHNTTTSTIRNHIQEIKHYLEQCKSLKATLQQEEEEVTTTSSASSPVSSTSFLDFQSFLDNQIE